MHTTAGNRNSISTSNEGILNTKHLCESDLILNTLLYSYLPQQ